VETFYNQFFAVIAAFGLCASLIVHLLTYKLVDVFYLFPEAQLLHIGMFVGVLAMLVSLRNKYGGSLTQQDIPKAALPAWAWRLVYAAAIYTAVNFALFFSNSVGGSPDIRDGRYVLADHAKIIRELSEDEYHIQQAYVARGFSGHWILFYLLPALYFGCSSNARPEQSSD
jgi:hypothetical protein